jgi:hypothetical protein
MVAHAKAFGHVVLEVMVNYAVTADGRFFSLNAELAALGGVR